MKERCWGIVFFFWECLLVTVFVVEGDDFVFIRYLFYFWGNKVVFFISLVSCSEVLVVVD